MDSLTQIVLGAACGEAVLGKKIGNKALLFGAIGGTIPDLDVFFGKIFYSNEIDIMLFHRGFMHSILFSVLASFLLGWLMYKAYENLKQNTFLGSMFSFLGTYQISRFLNTSYNRHKQEINTTQKDWVKLFFWSLFTHPILDCFTPYGTQLFAPFSNYRVAFNNIAVADPLYTLPFLIAMIVLMFFKRQNMKRRLWLKIGIGLSSFYMLLTVCNKIYIDSLFTSSLEKEGIVHQRFSTQPSILNNILWYGVAETEDSYKVAYYSLFDELNTFSGWKTLPKKRALKEEDFKDLRDLAWFSNNYYSVEEIASGEYMYKDLRYPLVETRDGFKPVFNLKLYKSNNRLDMKSFAPEIDDLKFTLTALWLRIKGI
nr:metal-dependent hydrolase [uncultured Psychroserpens sp.]